jgi:hypothetical protein
VVELYYKVTIGCDPTFVAATQSGLVSTTLIELAADLG